MNIYSFSSRDRAKKEIGEIISYRSEGVEKYGKDGYQISLVRFFTSHYIGFYSTVINNQSVSISITPRFGYGSTFFNYLLSYAYGLYLPKGGFSGSSDKNKQSDCYWMMAMLWKASLEKALSKSQTTKQYLKRETNDRFFSREIKLSKTNKI